MEGEEARYVATKQNGRRLLDNAGYQYSLNKKRPGKTNYICAQFLLLNCTVKATVDTTVQPNRIIEIRGTHSHDTNMLKSTVRNMEKKAIEDAARNSTVAPRFPLTMWNKYDVVLNDDPTTSNAAEGYNHALGISVPRNASIWTVIETLRTEESSFLRKLHDSVLGAANPDAGKSRTYRRQQRRVDIKNIVKNYGKLSKKQYIYDLIDFFD